MSKKMSDEERYVELVRTIVQSPYWKSQGESFFGKPILPKNIGKIRNQLLEIDFNSDKLKTFVSSLPEKSRRSPTTKVFYEILKSNDALPTKIVKLENIKNGIDKIMQKEDDENNTSFKFGNK